MRPIALPRQACLPISRCNLPPRILGSLSFQRHPSPLRLDGVAESHRGLFAALDLLADPTSRAQRFIDYMTVHFRLERLEEAGFTTTSPRSRAKANYLRMLRGWAFDAEGREGAVLKGWVESRFGLLPRFHREPLRDFSGPGYRGYLEQRAAGLYGTNAVEAQLDLVYTYCQYELARTVRGLDRLILFRGVNRIAEHEVLAREAPRREHVLLNSLSSFSHSRERAGEFGDYILSAAVPLPKIFFFSRLLPNMLKGEDEYIVIGGLYEVDVATF